LSYITEANSADKRKKRKKKQEKGKRGALAPARWIRPSTRYHPLYFPDFLLYMGGHKAKRSLNRLIIAQS